MAGLLIQVGASVSMPNHKGDTPLHKACRLAAEKGPRPGTPSPVRGEAALLDTFLLCKLLLSKGAHTYWDEPPNRNGREGRCCVATATHDINSRHRLRHRLWRL